jgi:glycosyltransferase involved in cell wall biosynthesis
MPVAFVVPCLNEESLIEKTAASLGFGVCAAPAADDVHLVLVDNGSSDGTLAAMERIRDHSRTGAVEILEEAERGYVPPRRTGALFVERLAHIYGGPLERWLILQADADTCYYPGYARRMQEALGDRSDVLLEGTAGRDPDFDAAHPRYRDMEREIDAAVEDHLIPDELDLVVDDKTCGYRLSDYLRWHGHFREYDPNGDEIHAETTRLLLRARLTHGVTKVRVNSAQAISSRRRILEDPALHFSTAGFPRETGWLRRWRERHPHKLTIEEFVTARGNSTISDARFYRRGHEIALFLILPWLVQRALEGESFFGPQGKAGELLELVPEFDRSQLADSPALALRSVFFAIEVSPASFAL